jgi:hypothetical protein
MAGRRRCATVVAGDDVLEFLGDRGGTDEVQTSEAMSNAWPVRSIVSRREEGKRSEELWQRRASVEVGMA